MAEKPTYDQRYQRVQELEKKVSEHNRIEIDGKIEGFSEFTKNITERVLAEQALRESEEQFRQLYENSVVGLFQTEIDGRLVMLNKKCAEIFGYESPEQALEAVKNVRDMYVRSEERLTYIADIHKQGFVRDREIECKKSNGDLFWININSVKSVEKDGSIFINGILTDVTDRKFAAAELKKFKTISDQANYGTAIVDLDGHLIYVNETFAMMHGFYPDELAGKHLKIFHTKDQMGRVNRLNEKLVNEGGFSAEEVWHVRKDGSVFLTSMNGFIIRKDDGRPYLMAATAIDITDRKLVEEALKKSEEKYRGILENIEDGYYEVDTSGNLTFFNKSLSRILGYPKSELMGMNYTALMDKENAEKMFHSFHSVCKTGQHARHADWKIIQKDGSERYIDASVSIICDVSGNAIGFGGIARDITKRKLAENELTKSRERLRELSTHLQYAREQERTHVAREIHDELGQALTAIKMDISWVKGKISKNQKAVSQKAEKTITLVDTAIKSVRRIITELRPGLLNDLGLTAALEWQLEEFEARTHINADITIDPEEIVLNDDLSTTIFRIFQETLTNIARHSRATHMKVRLKKTDGEIELIVKDNGIGITEDQIFRRNAFGLMGMTERVHAVGGRIKISGSPDQGTTVMVSIPFEE